MNLQLLSPCSSPRVPLDPAGSRTLPVCIFLLYDSALSVRWRGRWRRAYLVWIRVGRFGWSRRRCWLRAPEKVHDAGLNREPGEKNVSKKAVTVEPYL
jgi:hypothetical protein